MVAVLFVFEAQDFLCVMDEVAGPLPHERADGSLVVLLFDDACVSLGRMEAAEEEGALEIALSTRVIALNKVI